jgi:hypothetical protein
MRKQDDVDRRQRIEWDAGRYEAAGAGEPDWRRSVAPHRIGENVLTAYLNQKRCVPNPGEHHLINGGPRANDL